MCLAFASKLQKYMKNYYFAIVSITVSGYLEQNGIFLTALIKTYLTFCAFLTQLMSLINLQ